MAPTSKQEPLPLAPDRAAISNRISLLLAKQSSVLKTMNLGRSTSGTSSNSVSQDSSQYTQAQLRAAREQEEDIFNSRFRPNEGVGYVSDTKNGETTRERTREDRMLRGRLLGAKGKRGGNFRKAVEESESDEDEGRSGLGKGKKRKRKREVAEDEEEDEEMKDLGDQQENSEPEDVHGSDRDGEHGETHGQQAGQEDHHDSKKSRKRKKKKQSQS